MEFCPRCGAIIIEKKKNSGCSRCNYSSKTKLKIKTSEKITEPKGSVAVVKKEDSKLLPMVAETCEKCGNKEVFFWTVQTRSSDEAETRFFKCVKCDHTWREYR